MARIIAVDRPTMSPSDDASKRSTASSSGGGGGRKLSFKTRGGGASGSGAASRNIIRTTKVSLPASSVHQIASKFNAVIVQDESVGRALLKKNSAGSKVKETVKKFENIDEPSSSGGVGGVTLSRRISLTKDPTSSHKIVIVAKNPSKLHKSTSKIKDIKKQEDPRPPSTEQVPIVEQVPEPKPAEPIRNVSAPKKSYLHDNLKINFKKELSLPKNHILDSVLLTENKPVTAQKPRSPSVEPNNSFLWRSKDPNSPDKENMSLPFVEERPKDTGGYGKINSPKNENPPPTPIDEQENSLNRVNLTANRSSLYRHLEEQQKQSISSNQSVKRTESIRSNTSYEDISNFHHDSHQPSLIKNYDNENSYDVIDDPYSDGEAIYDDVLNVIPSRQCNGTHEGIYESIYGVEERKEGAGMLAPSSPGSDSSFEKNNSLYDMRPPSQASSSSSGRIPSAGSRKSDTSDEWVDVDLPDHQGPVHQEVIVLEEKKPVKHKLSMDSWSQKVRRQWSNQLAAEYLSKKVAVTSTSIICVSPPPAAQTQRLQPPPVPGKPCNLRTLGLVSLRDVTLMGPNYEAQEVTIYLLNEGDNENVDRLQNDSLDAGSFDDSSQMDDFDDSESETELNADNKPHSAINQNGQQQTKENDGIYGLMRTAGKKMKQTSWSIGKRLRRMSKITMMTATPAAAPNDNVEPDVVNGKSGEHTQKRWHSFKSNRKGRMSTFYLETADALAAFGSGGTMPSSAASTPGSHQPPSLLGSTPSSKSGSNVDVRRLSTSAVATLRPTSPPPPPPPMMNGERKFVNDTSLYMQSGLFDSQTSNQSINDRLRSSNNNSWYSDVGLYENNFKAADSASEHDSSGSNLDLRFADEPLYQFYAACVAELERYDKYSELGYEEIRSVGTPSGPSLDYSSPVVGEGGSVEGDQSLASVDDRPSALDLVSPENLQRTLWCQVPQVVNSGILDTLSVAKKRLQEAKFELVTSEASYYKSLIVLERHFASSPLLKDENVMSKVHYKTLFGNLTPVRKVSEAVLAALEKCWQESILLEGVCDVVLELAEEKFSTYVKYCKHQGAIEKILKTLKNTSPAFVEALTTLESSPECHSLSLSSFLLLPMQRVTRMPLLMDAILTKLEPTSSEIEPCRKALSHFNKVANDCNEAARQTERLEEMAMISQSLTFPRHLRPLPLLSASRWLVKSGQVYQVNSEAKLTFSKKQRVKLTLFLFNDYLVIAKKKTEETYSVITYCPRNLVQMAKMDDPVSGFGYRYLINLTLIENHEGKTQEMVIGCSSETCRERWLQPFHPANDEDPDQRQYEIWDCPQVSAKHSYVSSQPDELCLQHGDVINVFNKMPDGWFFGERIRNGEKGWFPGNYTVEIASAHVRARNLRQRHRILALSSSFIQEQKLSKVKKTGE